MPKINELSTISNLTQATYAPVTSGGVTYKYDLKAKFDNISTVITPLSDLSRVFALDGSGIPLIPDNAAGTIFRLTNYSTLSTGWNVNSGTPSSTFFSNEKIWRIDSDSLGEGYYFNTTSKIAIITFKVIYGSWAVGLNLTKQVFTPGETITKVFSRTTDIDFDIYATTSSASAIEISDIYIGSGLYDTPVYGKDGKTVWTNHGVVPVPGKRGNAMLFQGAQHLMSVSPIFATTGTLGVFFKLTKLNTLQIIFTNADAGAQNGWVLILTDDNILHLYVGGASSIQDIPLGTISNLLDHSVVFSCDGSNIKYSLDNGTLQSVALTVTPSMSSGPFVMGKNTIGQDNAYFNGIIYEIRGEARIWTQADVTRFNNGDDPVDCHQKSQTNTPYAIPIRDSKGNLRQPGLPVYSDNGAATAGGLVAGEPYRTSTGVMMITY